MAAQASIFYRPWFWISFSVAAGIAASFSFVYFPQAIPLLDLSITMNREQALEQAQEVAKRYGLGPVDYEQAAYFTCDNHVQNYIELEAGGKQVWQKIIREGLYQPYGWCVRHFKEGDVNETLIKFTSEGKLYGFEEIVSERKKGAHIPHAQAREQVELFLTNEWHIDLADYYLLESSEQKQPSDRIDHTFVYELSDKQESDAYYRLAIILSGDKISKISRFMNIPESFTRRYQSMRSGNDTLATIAQFVIYVLYLFIGCFIGLLFLYKRNWVLIKPALVGGIFIAILQALGSCSELSSIWCSYDTAESAHYYLINSCLSIALSFFSSACLYTLTFAAAEALTRKAFGNHLQFWKLWQSPALHSYQLLGRTIAGYLLVAFDFAFVIAFYTIGNKYFGWWSPATMLTNPDILHDYIPWLSAITKSIKAGVWEECLFRAIPLAGSALIGQYFGKRKLGIGIGFIMQAVIFGAAHANYPGFPSYVRLLELLVPSLIWGLVYLFFGLLPCILCHSIYDAILFALPLFISKAPGSMIHSLFALVSILIPLSIVLFKWLLTKEWVHATHYNDQWQPLAQTPYYENKHEHPESAISLSSRGNYVLMLACAMSFGFWYATTTIKPDVPTLRITKDEAIINAKQLLADRNILITDEWQFLTKTIDPKDKHGEYVWQKEGKHVYSQLLGNYLPGPGWVIRLAKFDKELIESAEEYQVYVKYDGSVYRVHHILPESRYAPELSQENAKELALNFIADTYHLESPQLIEKGVSFAKRPHRLDWTFDFEVSGVLASSSAQAVISIVLTGNEIVDAHCSLQLPEDWQRLQQREDQLTSIITMLQSFMSSILIAIGLFLGIAAFMQNFMKLPILLMFGIATIMLHGLKIINDWPSTIFFFNTSKPFYGQSVIWLLPTIIAIIAHAVWVGLIAGYAYYYQKNSALFAERSRIVTGLSLGMIYTAILAAIRYFCEPTMPLWPMLVGANAFIPWLSYTTHFLLSYVKQTIFLLLVTLLLSKKFSWASFLVIIAVSIATATYYPFAPLNYWVLAIGLLILSYALVYRTSLIFDMSLIPLISAVPSLAVIVSQISVVAYPGGEFSSGIAFFAVVITSFLWSRLLKYSYASRGEVVPQVLT